MKYNELGQSGIKVSELCLGTMTGARKIHNQMQIDK